MTKKHSNKWDKYWIIWGKIALFIAIILLINYFFMGSSDDLDYKEERVKDLIQDRYEITSVGIMDLLRNESLAYVDMISLGNRNDQVFEGMSALGIIYENASIYMVTIFEESQRCDYIIDGEIYEDITDWINLIDYQIEEIENCY